jgi:ubiquinone/menaquinone biosynthesis C-methylase UbiE
MINLKKYTPKFFWINSRMGNKPFSLLDIGSGNHSASKTKNLFPNCEYHGIDLSKNGYDESDLCAMHIFYKMDLTKLEMSAIPENHFNYISMNHVIEHLHNADKVIELLMTKLKSKGYIYREFPGQRSTKLPSMYGTLNFYDDPTHVRIYSNQEISKILEDKGFRIISAGTRRNLLMILAIPFRLFKCLVTNKEINANIFWDILGFAEYVFAQKK